MTRSTAAATNLTRSVLAGTAGSSDSRRFALHRLRAMCADHKRPNARNRVPNGQLAALAYFVWALS